MDAEQKPTSALRRINTGGSTSIKKAGVLYAAGPAVTRGDSLLTTITNAVKGTRQKEVVLSASERFYARDAIN